MGFSNHSDIEGAPWKSNDPRGFKKFVCGQEITITQALGKVGMSMEEVGRFNFGDDLKEYGVDSYEKCFDEFYPYLCWWREAKELTGDADSEDDPSWFWVPGDCKLDPDPDPHDASLSGYKNPFEEQKALKEKEEIVLGRVVPPLSYGKEYYAARSQPEDDGVWAMATVDTGFKAGDILLSHHPKEDFISKITLSWPTHAGIALNEAWAADADVRKEDSEVRVVDYISLKDFFDQKDTTKQTPHGGLVYRYIGKKGDKEENLEAIRRKAAVWAKKQTRNTYKFSLEHSYIVGKKGGVVEKEFDAQGKAVDKDGKRLKFKSKKAKKWMETEQQTIYCAELVWRAYREAGVNIVDPKKFANIYEDSSQGIASVLAWKIRGGGQSFEELKHKKIEELDKKIGKVKGEFDAAEGPKGIAIGIGLDTLKLIKGILNRSKLKWIKVSKAMPASIMRKIVKGLMKARFEGYFCAPYQLAQTKLTERVAQLPPIDDGHKKIELTSFWGKGIHPYDVLEAANSEKDGWEEYKKEKGEPLEVSLEKPWRLSKGETKAPELKLDSEDVNKLYNVPVDIPERKKDEVTSDSDGEEWDGWVEEGGDEGTSNTFDEEEDEKLTDW